jgi:hypothetical protein
MLPFNWECELCKFACKTIMFKKPFNFEKPLPSIITSKLVEVISYVSLRCKWNVSQIIVDILSLVVITCI